jgi:hypothetical protein
LQCWMAFVVFVLYVVEQFCFSLWHTFIPWVCLLFSNYMENMQSLLEFVQSKDIFICDFIIVVQVFQGKLYTMYYVIILSFKGDGFGLFVICYKMTAIKSIWNGQLIILKKNLILQLVLCD